MEPGDVRFNGGFPATRHSAIERIRDADPETRREAFGDLVEGYWRPVYKHLRLTWHLDAEDARDLTQGFFADAFQKAWLERYEPGKARFRTFVRVCADRFVMNMRQSSSRLKRGGGVQTLPLDFDGAEREVTSRGLVSIPDPDEYFHQEFVRALFDKTVQDLRDGVRGARAPDPLHPLRALRPRSGRGCELRAAGRRVQSDAGAGDEQPRTGPPAFPRTRARRAARPVRQRPGVPPRGAGSLWTGRRMSGRVSTKASGLSDAAVDRLRALGRWPEFESGRYSVTEEIGRGGMGTVFLAVDEELGREVAIKIPNALASADLERRLRSEARVLARLEHPGIVPIHDAGRLADGRLFYVMKRVRGRTLREQLQSVPDLTERLRIFERICEPVAFAHAQGFIHRDLKPENVMVGSFGEVMVMDWGVAKAVGSPQPGSAVAVDNRSPQSSAAALPVETAAGTVVGTVGFMAPEQARGAGADVDERADVYGLGAILFLLLTDRVPDADPQGTLRHMKVPRPLAAICNRALAAEPSARYQRVTALADDVARYRDNRKVDAYRETVVEGALRFGRTYRTAILLVLAYVVMRAAVAFFARW